jgi:hypothetical protein
MLQRRVLVLSLVGVGDSVDSSLAENLAVSPPTAEGAENPAPPKLSTVGGGGGQALSRGAGA